MSFEMRGIISRIGFDEKGRCEITFTTKAKPEELENFRGGRELNIQLTHNRAKRSLTANNYMWALLDELSEALNESRELLYQRAIKDVGKYEDIIVPIDAYDDVQRAWNSKGTGWFAELVDTIPDFAGNECGQLRLYYGSSSYDTHTMKRLLDYIVQDCQAVGINTMTDRELSLLSEKWKGSY